MNRWDETWHRLREWTNGPGPSERLAAQVLAAEGYRGIDPSHPLGGRDAGKDALVLRGDERWIMAVHFPRGEKSFGDIKTKFVADHQGVASNRAAGMAFVTNQELSLAQRAELEQAVDTPVDIFHLERVTLILDQPEMHGVREQFLRIRAVAATDASPPRTLREVLDGAPQTPGAPDHWMVHDGILLLRVDALPAPEGIRHPNAADPRQALAEASAAATEVAHHWPHGASLLISRLGEGWRSLAPHRWGAGRSSDRPETLARSPTAAIALDTRRVAVAVDRTWPTRVYDDRGDFAYHAAREPEVLAEVLVALRLIGALLDPVPGLGAIDVAVQIAAAPAGTTLVSSERAVSGGRFGEPAGYLPQPVTTEVSTHYSDNARIGIGDLVDPYLAAEQLVAPWVTPFRADNLLERLRHS